MARGRQEPLLRRGALRRGPFEPKQQSNRPPHTGGRYCSRSTASTLRNRVNTRCKWPRRAPAYTGARGGKTAVRRANCAGRARKRAKKRQYSKHGRRTHAYGRIGRCGGRKQPRHGTWAGAMRAHPKAAPRCRRRNSIAPRPERLCEKKIYV